MAAEDGTSASHVYELDNISTTYTPLDLSAGRSGLEYETVNQGPSHIISSNSQPLHNIVPAEYLEFVKKKEKSVFGGADRCKRVWLVVVAFVLLLLLVIALVAGLLALAVIFTGFVDFCGQCSTADVTPDSSAQQIVHELTASFETRLEELKHAMETRILELEVDLETLQNASTAPLVPKSTTPVVPMTTTEAVTTDATVRTTPSSPIMMGTIATLREVDLFPNCTTRVEASCTIPPGTGTGRCITIPALIINNPGEFVLNMNCLRAEETINPNPLVAVLDVFEDREASCLCFVPDLQPTGRQSFPGVVCGLRVTRCVSSSNITVTISDEL